jgi:hypothetical protein
MNASANNKNIKMFSGDCSIKCINESFGFIRKMYAEDTKQVNITRTSVTPNKYLNDGILFINFIIALYK